MILYGILFLFNYGGTALSALISVVICLLMWFFRLLLEKPHSRPLKPVAASAISAILLGASFINLLILLP